MIIDKNEVQYFVGDIKMFVGDEYGYYIGKMLMLKNQKNNFIDFLVVYVIYMGSMGFLLIFRSIGMLISSKICFRYQFYLITCIVCS